MMIIITLLEFYVMELVNASQKALTLESSSLLSFLLTNVQLNAQTLTPSNAQIRTHLQSAQIFHV